MRRWITVAVAATILAVVPSSAVAGQFPDFSNNDPCYCAAQLKHHGIIGAIDKANQGTGFIDLTFAGMVADAKAHKLPIGGYDFDELYTAQEAYTFVARLKAVGINRSTVRSFPPTLDIEYGHANRAGLEHQLAVLFRVYGRVQIYTGSYYWEEHFGCWAPANVTFWIAGYPSAKRPCGVSGAHYLAHQFTDHGFNGAGYADLSDFFGPTFAHFIQAVPVQLNTAGLKASLTKHQQERKVMHGDIDRHKCRPGQHNLPRNPQSLRLKFHSLCGRWLLRGAEIIRVESRIRKSLRG
jgi:hypothetical protein